MSDTSKFFHMVLYSDQAKAVYEALVSSGHDALAAMVASGSRRSETDYKFIAAMPKIDEIDESALDYDEVPVVFETEEGGYVMLWYWVSNEDAGVNCEQKLLDEALDKASDYQI
jgi:hypothetical protein